MGRAAHRRSSQGPVCPPLAPVQGIPDLRGQLLDGEGLLYEEGPLVQDPVTGDGISRIAGHEQGFEIRVQAPEMVSQVLAVHPGHHHIGHGELDRARMGMAILMASFGPPADKTLYSTLVFAP